MFKRSRKHSSSGTTAFAKKSLGQNFLRSERALADMIDAGNIKPGDAVMEIGPGEGALTSKLLESGAVLTVIEKDDRLIPILQEKYAAEIAEGKLRIIHGDVINLLKDETFIKNLSKGEAANGNTYKVIANIPYYITGLILRALFEQDTLPENVVLLVQKEVADRIVALGEHGKQATAESQNGAKESLLSLSVKLYGTPRRVSVVPKGAFVPAPTVDSAIISIENIRRKISKDREDAFFKLIHAAFSHKRKRLAKNLELFDANTDWDSHLHSMDLDKNARAEDLSVEKYIQLLDRLI